MSFTRCIIASLALALIFLTSGTYSSQPMPGPDCFAALLNMSDCLTFVEQGSNLTSPDKPCCSELAGLVDTNPVCSCRLLGNAASFGVHIDDSRVMKLPEVCNVSTPSVSSCSAAGVPVGGPVLSPTAPSPSGFFDTADAVTPSNLNDDNGACSLKDMSIFLLASISLVLVHLVI